MQQRRCSRAADEYLQRLSGYCLHYSIDLAGRYPYWLHELVQTGSFYTLQQLTWLFLGVFRRILSSALGPELELVVNTA